MIKTFVSCLKLNEQEYYLIMVRVFKTDVDGERKAKQIIDEIHKQYPDLRITFDLEDSEKILRVEGVFFNPDDIIKFVENYGNICIDLPIEL